MWPGRRTSVIMSILAVVLVTAMASESTLILDDRRTGDLRSAVGTSWRLITDAVMGGVSEGRLTADTVAGRNCLRLQGAVSLDNRGGFIQVALDSATDGVLDASSYSGVLLDVYGNDEQYNVHLRTKNVWLPWQAYRASFAAPATWRTVRIPFSAFSGYRIGAPLDTAALQRIGIVAIGRTFQADLCLSRLGLYREDTESD